MESCPSGRRSTIGNRVSRYRGFEGSNPSLSAIITYIIGPLVKRLRHRPFTAVTRVRIPYGSPTWRISSAGRAPALQAGGRRFEPCILHHLYFIRYTIISHIAGWSSLVARWAHNPKVVGSNPAPATKLFQYGPVVQLVRMPACHAGGRGFESRPDRHFQKVAYYIFRLKLNYILWLGSSVGRAED